MSCRDMGGPCDTKFTADTSEEMMKKGSEHLKTETDEAHTKITDQMETMTPKENEERNEEFMKKWKNTPES